MTEVRPGSEARSSDNSPTAYPAFPIFDLLTQRARATPGKIALEAPVEGETLSYETLDRRAAQAATLLRSQLREDQRMVAILCHNCTAFFEILFACGRSGVVLVPLNWRQTAQELLPILRDCGACVLLFDGANASLARQLHELHDIPLMPLDKTAAGMLPETPPAYPELRDGCDAVFERVVHDPGDLWYLLYTSGTTGKPKAVMQTFGMALANYINTAQAIDLTGGDRTLNFLPLFHTAGINLYTLPVLIAGGTAIILPRFDEHRTMELIDAGRLSVFFAVPAVYRALAEHPDFADADLSGVRSWGCGGAPVQAYILQQYMDRGIRICCGYGMTETGPMTFLMDPEQVAEKPASIGKPQLLTQVRIADEKGVDVPPGEPGELLMRGPNVTPGYWGNPEATRTAFHPGGWLRSGDVAKADSDGYYYIVDRIKDMYISGAENVYPTEVEQVLEQHPDILEAAVVGMADARWGEVGCAFIRVRPGAQLDQSTCHTYARDRLAAYKVPRAYIVVEDFPRTAAGKIQKKVLREQTPK